MSRKPQFVNIDFGAAFTARYESEFIHAEDWSFHSEELLERGYKVTLSTNTTGDGKSVTITDRRYDKKDAIPILTAWGGEVGKAFQKAYWFVLEAERRDIDWFTLEKELEHIRKEDQRAFEEFIRNQRAKGTSEGV